MLQIVVILTKTIMKNSNLIDIEFFSKTTEWNSFKKFLSAQKVAEKVVMKKTRNSEILVYHLSQAFPK